MLKKKVSIYGATGSIGRAALEVIAANSEKFSIDTLVAKSNFEELARSAHKFEARHVVAEDERVHRPLLDLLEGTGISVATGRQAVLEAAEQDDAELVIAAISGVAGLYPLARSIKKNRVVAIANKEPLVAAGPLVRKIQKESGARILPIDSEHNAIFQVLEEKNREQVESFLLTGSGGPFLRKSIEEMKAAGPKEALCHPNWTMGPKNTIDSATMMNKALEVIEAITLFQMPPEKIKVVIHPQSIIHSMVAYKDGSVLAQMGAPDMKTPIAHVLAYPGRLPYGGKKLDVFSLSSLSFELPDFKKFPFLQMAYDAYAAGQGACVVMNAANEVAVSAFLKKEIGFLQIYGAVAQAMDTDMNSSRAGAITTLEDVEALDRDVRRQVQSYIKEGRITA